MEDLPAPIMPMRTIGLGAARTLKYRGKAPKSKHQAPSTRELLELDLLELLWSLDVGISLELSIMPETKPLVAILMGSKSDWETMRHAVEALDALGVPNEARVLSAHRTPEATTEFARKAAGRGIRVIIAGAGGAAHLAGVIAAHTLLPVLGVPIQSKLNGLDSLLSTAQMPGGIPVGTLAIGDAGAKNAGLLAAAIIALSDENVGNKLKAFRKKQSESVLAAMLPK
jgi:5-(carboxyamino)imidazole ribonucleotide mutase